MGDVFFWQISASECVTMSLTESYNLVKVLLIVQPNNCICHTLWFTESTVISTYTISLILLQ